MDTVLFVDIVGSTGLYEKLGNTIAKQLVTDCLNRLRTEVGAHSGEVVQAIGDELMCHFSDAGAACAAAIAMQRRITEPLPGSTVALQVRIGLQAGEALQEGNNLYGDAVNTAARLSHIAQGGQIMTSEAVVQQAGAAVSGRWREIGPLGLKGKKQPLSVCEIFWKAPQDQTGSQTALMMAPAPGRAMRLHVTFGTRTFDLGPDQSRFTLGRGKDNDLVIPYAEASRHHATIEHRMDKHYLVDHSANGTTIIGPDQTPWMLRREEVPLTGSGRILCGYTLQLAETREPVHFAIREC